MEKTPRAQAILFLLLVIHFTAAHQNATTTNRPDEFHVGVILDMASLVGKVSRTSISLAVQDFYSAHQNYRTKLVIHFKDSMGSYVQAAAAAIDLLENYKVQAIIGPQKSSEAAFIANLGNVTQVPIISFTATSPSLISANMPYFVRATLNDSVQVNAIASLIKAYGWREVILVYDDNEYGRGILPYFIDTLQQFDARVPYHSVIPTSATSENIMQELYKLMTMQTRVFVVHMSPTSSSLLFTKAKEVGMINKGFVWIITMGLANIMHSLSPSVIEAMNGVIGVRFHVPKLQQHDTGFLMRWNRMYELDNPNELALNKLSVVGLWGYDTVWALAQAAEKVGVSSNKRKKILHPGKNSTFLELTSTKGPELLRKIIQNKFQGLSGSFDLTGKQLQVFELQIINVVGERCRHIGFWTLLNGLSRQLYTNKSKITASISMFNLNPVIWPGESTETPRGWDISASGSKIRVGVHRSAYREFMWTSRDPTTNAISVSGLSAEVFEEVVKRLPFALNYEYEAFGTVDGTSSKSNDDFIQQVYLQRYDIAVGDTTIRYNRTFYVDFTLPYTESGMAMIVAVKTKDANDNMWIFLKPLSKGMWFGSIMLFIYTGLVIWLLERLNGNGYLHGPLSLKQLGILIFFSISEEKEKLECLLSRIVLLVWMFVLLVVTSSYTATFASMLTVQHLSPAVSDIRELQKDGGYVGFSRGSYIEGVLQDIGFDRSKIRAYDTPDDFHSALSNGSENGGVSAMVLEVPYVKLFLAKYCKGYTMVGPIYKSAGFAFALPRGSPLLAHMSRAIVNITEGDTIIQIEKKWILHQNKCQNDETKFGSDAITFSSFGGLFLLTGCVTTCSLCVALLMNYYRKDEPKAGTKLDGSPNQQKHGTRQGEKGRDPQEGDQSEDEDGGSSSNDAENQAKVTPVPLSSNTSCDLPQVCTHSKMASVIATDSGSLVVTRRVNKVQTSPSSSSLLVTSELSEAQAGSVDVKLNTTDNVVDLGSKKNLLQNTQGL